MEGAHFNVAFQMKCKLQCEIRIFQREMSEMRENERPFTSCGISVVSSCNHAHE